MTLMQTILLFGCVVLGVFFLIDAALYYLGGNEDVGQKRIKRRLAGKAKKEAIKKSSLKRQQQEEGNTFAVDSYLANLIRLSDSNLTVKNVYFIVIALTFALAMIFYMLLPFVPLFGGLVLSLLLSFFIIVLVLKKQVQSRNYKFEEQFPDAIELIVRSLRVGQPFTKAILSVANEMPDPIAKEFKITSQEIAYGRNLPEALDDMLMRIAVPDLKFFVVAIQIQHESGGNLAEILENLSKIIRGRFRLLRKVKALTVEGRFSAWFLSLFPVVMIFVMNGVNPGYYADVSDHPYFYPLVGLTTILLVVNVVAMRIMTKLEV